MRFLVAIPAYNEAAYIRRVLPSVQRYAKDVVVIDDGSTDATPEILREFPNVRVLRREQNRGYGQSVIDGFEYAFRAGYDWVITLDCDEQHDPALIERFVERMRADKSDIISGSRYLQDDPAHDAPPADRARINRTCNDLLDQLLGLKLTDSFCGFKAHRVSALRKLRLTEAGYAFPLQLWVQCVRAGLRVEEVPVTRVYRDATRTFGEVLNDPARRLQHYLEVLLRELRAPQVRATETLAAASEANGKAAVQSNGKARRVRAAREAIEAVCTHPAHRADECERCRLPA
jgi:glycosyltransferase involved in cell wall biosynthesis